MTTKAYDPKFMVEHMREYQDLIPSMLGEAERAIANMSAELQKLRSEYERLASVVNFDDDENLIANWDAWQDLQGRVGDLANAGYDYKSMTSFRRKASGSLSTAIDKLQRAADAVASRLAELERA